MLKSIVIINDNARITGGADKIALTSGLALAQRGYQVHLLTAVGPIDPQFAGVPNFTVHCTHQYEILCDPSRLRAATQGLWNLKSHQSAVSLFEHLDPKTTVVHLHLWAKALSSSVVRAAAERGFPIACTLHDYLLACPAGTLFDHPRQSICHRRPMSLSCVSANCDSRNYADKLWRVARQLTQVHLGGLPGALTDVVAISERVINVLRPYLPTTINVHRLSNFVDIDRQDPAPVASNRDFIFTGRLVKEKGPVLFANAAQAEDVSAVFLGDGESRQEVLQVNAKAQISGWLPYHEALGRLRSGRVMVFPSLWYEAQPLVVLEALAQGVPCIVADTSAASELITDHETGLLFRGGDVDDLRAKIRQMQNASFAERLGLNAYNTYWREPRTLDRHIQGLLGIYESMLSRSMQPRL